MHLQRWRDAILETCAELGVSLDTWLLPLSGGLDSRVLLAALIAADRRPRCVTWGLRRSLDDPENDAVVARRLAEHYRLDHRFLATDMDDTPARVVIDRFLAAGEGRTDQIAGYLDGLRVWKTLYEDGVSGIIRGDEPAWGYTTIYTNADVTRRGDGGAVVADYPQGHLIRQLGLAPQSLPAWMARGDGETLQHYASRLWERHGFQAHLAPLNDVKAAYVEIVNPFICDRVMTVARALPETLRSQRRGFKAVAAGLARRYPWRSTRRSTARAGCCRPARRSSTRSPQSCRLLRPSASATGEGLTGSSPRSHARYRSRRAAGPRRRTSGRAAPRESRPQAETAADALGLQAGIPAPPGDGLATMLEADAAALRDGASASPTTPRTSASP